MGVRRQNRSYLIAFFVLSTPLPIFVIVVGMLTFSSYDLFNEILVRHTAPPNSPSSGLLTLPL